MAGIALYQPATRRPPPDDLAMRVQIDRPLDDLMRLLWRDRELSERMGENGLRFAQTFCTESHAREEMREFLAGCGLTA